MNPEEKILFAIKKGYKIDKDGVCYKNDSIIKGCMGNRPYKAINIRLKGTRKQIRISVHRLQAYLKFGSKIFEDNVVVRHLDNNSLNNSWDNIAIGTRSMNMLDVPQDIRKGRALKSSKLRRKLNTKQYKSIFLDRNSGMKLRELSKKYKISMSTASYILNYKTYKVF